MTVKAVDKDVGENGRITYHFKVNGENVHQTDEFSIDTDSGELRSRKYLDREAQAKYEVTPTYVFYFQTKTLVFLQLTLVARDHGSPKWYETIRSLTVLLVDMNDNRPEFPDSKNTNPYMFYVTENGAKNERIGELYSRLFSCLKGIVICNFII